MGSVTDSDSMGRGLPNRDRSQLLVIDVQDRIMPSIGLSNLLVDSLSVLVDSASEFGVPITASEHYVSGLGPSIPPIRDKILPENIFEKSTFSCYLNEDIRDRVLSLAEEKGRNQLVIAGIEAHICVLLSAVDFLRENLDVVIAADVVGSRYQDDLHTALHALRHRNRIEVLPLESIVFSWCQTSENTSFKTISKLIKHRSNRTL